MAGENSNGRKASKTRYWAFIVYPESAPKNWLSILEDLHMQALVSPLHDKDLDSEGRPKKPHWHVLLLASGPISQKRADEIIEPFGGTKSAEYVLSSRGYVRYLAHLDNPDKAQYNPAEIKAFGGADITKLITSEHDQMNVFTDIMSWCEDQGVCSFSVLLRYARTNQKNWLPPLIKYAFFFTRYLSSLKSEFEHR